MAPRLLELGSASTNGPSPRFLVSAPKPASVGGAGCTVSVALALPAACVAVAAWWAVSVVVPAPTSVTTLPLTVATAGWLLV
jgi:hypothetical protein